MARRYRLYVEYERELLPEDMPVEGNAMASGDPAIDQETYDWIHDQLARGNEAAWATARLTAHLRFSWEPGVLNEASTGDFYLGGCSYESEERLWESMRFEYNAENEARQFAENKMREYLLNDPLAIRRAFERLMADLNRTEQMRILLERQQRAHRILERDPTNQWAQQELVHIDDRLEKL